MALDDCVKDVGCADDTYEYRVGWVARAWKPSKTPEIHTKQAEHVAIAFIPDNIHSSLLRQNTMGTLTSYVGHLVGVKYVCHVMRLLA